MKIYKQRHPEEYFYNVLRSNAKRRGKEFTLTIEEFKQFCKDTNYLNLKGKNGNDFSIDRKESWLGYSHDNIQLKTLSDNVKKQREQEKCPF